MVYADEDKLETLYNALAEDISADLEALALDASTAWVDSKLPAPLSGTIPNLVETAATYYSYVFILKNLYDTIGDESPMMDWYEKQANDLLAAYVEQNVTEDSTMHPYSGNLTPTHAYTERILRYVDDNDEYEHYNVDDDEWIAEE